ncbi:hypothetical protein [Streptomyces cavernicola]|uniref:Uncharacterized protein n=1 Tax=Streptomyces cavernicola TaxID=3043613 RepID=A0ABT6S2V4_9ACTN|nr:hypothetical protein [Streptomyces sp. B-S-A6]MDI3402421.1 hypothetical protein [Streptomyces sp. B-S-A6]
MDGDEQTAQLEWWANPSTCLVRIPVTVTAVGDGTAWDASPRLDDTAARESLAQLIADDPWFTLRVEGSESVVRVELIDRLDKAAPLRLTAPLPSPHD